MPPNKRQTREVPNPRRQRHPRHAAQRHGDAPVFEEDLGAEGEVIEEAAAAAGELVPEADEVFVAGEIIAAAAHHLARDVEQIIDGEDCERVGDPGPGKRNHRAEAPFEDSVGNAPDTRHQKRVKPRRRRESEERTQRRAARDVFRRPLAAQHRDHQAITQRAISSAALMAALVPAATRVAVRDHLHRHRGRCCLTERYHA